jgi:hypothetical protein
MDIGTIVIVFAVVFTVPIVVAVAQSRWEIASQRRRATRMSSANTALGASQSSDKATSAEPAPSVATSEPLDPNGQSRPEAIGARHRDG